MSDYQEPGYYREEQRPEQTGSTGAKVATGCGIGCLALVLVTALGVFLMIRGVQSRVDNFTDNYASDDPITFEYPNIQLHEVETIIAKFNNFRDALANDELVEPLVLSADDINIIINHHSSFKPMAGKSKFDFQDNQLVAEVSIRADRLPVTIPFISKAIDGKYINGTATVDLEISGDKAKMFLLDFKLAEIEVPQQVFDYLEGKNLLENAKADPGLKDFMAKVDELKIDANMLYIIPRDKNQEEPELAIEEATTETKPESADPEPEPSHEIPLEIEAETKPKTNSEVTPELPPAGATE